jgi:hypothetical protein
MNPEYTYYVDTNLINKYTDYTPNDLRKMADYMEANGIISFECETSTDYDYTCLECSTKRLPTPEEIEKKRLDKEAELARTKARELEQLKKLQEKYMNSENS